MFALLGECYLGGVILPPDTTCPLRTEHNARSAQFAARPNDRRDVTTDLSKYIGRATDSREPTPKAALGRHLAWLRPFPRTLPRAHACSRYSIVWASEWIVAKKLPRTGAATKVE